MIPFRDNIPSRRDPVLTVALIALNVLVYFFQWVLDDQARTRFVFRFGAIPRAFQVIGKGEQAFSMPLGQPQWVLRNGQEVLVDPPLADVRLSGTWAAALVPLVTSMFLHGSWLHVIGNMWFLWLFGDNVEDRLGRARFVLLYLLSGLAATVSQVIVNWGELTPIIGASGAVAGVLGAYMITYPYARVLTFVPFFYFFWPVVELPAFVFLLLWFLMQFVQGTAALAVPAAGGVAWWAHVGGFIAGLILMRLIAPEPRGQDGPTWNEPVESP